MNTNTKIEQLKKMLFAFDKSDSMSNEIIKDIFAMFNESKELAKFRSCYKCEKLSLNLYRWYHSDQDDLICEECAKETTHSDTSYSGMNVFKTMSGE